ncbi:MAG TPA: HAD-IC family P-type ATPase [Steroidobacteraceae bacterium]|nr:HAD-IC family P-type ATPase [Steroidobacteraceae bacterium]
MDPVGLSTAEAQRLLRAVGPNALPDATPSKWRQAVGRLSAPIPWMLEIAILLQFALREYAEAAVIAVLLVFNALLGQIQETRAQATLDALKSRLALLASVRRDGRWQTLPATGLVPGDLISLTLGGVVPADARLLAGNVLLDQSMLTGESLPVEAGPGTVTYAGSLVRRGEATAEVTATGGRTKFGRTAQLVSVAHAISTQQQAVLRVVRNLAFFSTALVAVQLTYATVMDMPPVQMIPLALTAVLAAIPVALPATFTLASAIAARRLAALGVLPTRLSAIDEAGTMDVLCSDKTGTLTQNALTVTRVQALPGFDESRVLTFAALASAEAGLDPVDNAVRGAAARLSKDDPPQRISLLPFDPARKLSEATVRDRDGRTIRILKGAVAALETILPASGTVRAAAAALQDRGYRVLAVAAGDPEGPAWAGLLALSDPPRADAGGMIRELGALGVQTVMITGDAAATASVVARAVGLSGPVFPPGPVPEHVQPGDFAVYAGVFPEDKFHLVRAFQRCGHTVGMCGDGANDAPALRQAQMGVAVATATDVAKAAAGLVLTAPGLGGILEAVRSGRVTYQRILTYTLRSVTTKINQMLFLTIGLIMTGHAILSPMLMVIVVISGDFLAMSATTDNVRPAARPNAWRIGLITVAAVILGICTVMFCSAILAVGYFHLGLENRGLRTLAAVTLVCSSQAAFYVVRDRRHLWSSRPSGWVVLSSVTDVSIMVVLAGTGTLMHALPWSLIGAVIAAAVLFAFALDAVKTVLFGHLRVV